MYLPKDLAKNRAISYQIRKYGGKPYLIFVLAVLLYSYT